MDSKTYRELYSKLGTLDDAKHLAENMGINDEVLLAILSLKLVRNTRRRFHELEGNIEELKDEWSNGRSFIELSRELDFPPVLMASLILQAGGMSRKGVWNLLKGHDNVPDERINRELKEAVKEDFLYSPWAHELQRRRAEAGERILEEWLLSMNADFIREKDAGNNRITPDFLLKEKLSIDGRRISWVESKASFGDRVEHIRYMKKQLTPYLLELGEGMVVYWCGCLDSLGQLEPRILIKDYEFFPEQKDMIKELFRLSRW